MKDELQELLDRVADGSGYGDPDARLNDDRRMQILIARQQTRILSWQTRLTGALVVVGLLQVVEVAVQIWKAKP